MNFLKVEFHELYARHLCRHSQYGNNVIHLAMVFGTYLGLFGIAGTILGSPWPALVVPVLYMVVLAFNVPVRVWLVSLLFVIGLCAATVALPEMPIWLPIGLVVVCYFVQNWSHKLYDKAADMTELNKKYRKGPALFVLLLIYELPLLLNYLCFDTSNWVDVLPPAWHFAAAKKTETAAVDK